MWCFLISLPSPSSLGYIYIAMLDLHACVTHSNELSGFYDVQFCPLLGSDPGATNYLKLVMYGDQRL